MARIAGEMLKDAVGDLMSRYTALETAEQANFPIPNGIANNSALLFSTYRDSPHLIWLYHYVSSLPPLSPSGTGSPDRPGIDRGEHIRGLIHEGMCHLVIRALNQQKGCKARVVFSPQTTKAFSGELNRVLETENDGDEPARTFPIDPDSYLVNLRTLLAEEDLEFTVRKGRTDKQPQKCQLNPYFEDKNCRFSAARTGFPELFAQNAVCRFVLTQGYKLPDRFVPPRNTPYEKPGLDQFAAGLMRSYTPGECSLPPLVKICIQLGDFIDRAIPPARDFALQKTTTFPGRNPKNRSRFR